MRIVAQFDPSAATSDTFNAGFSRGVGKIVVYNESNINLSLAWGAFTTYCPAWTAMLYCISTNNVNIAWQQESTLVTSTPPISRVTVEAYDSNESVLGTFPAPLTRQTNIGGGSVTATVTQTQTLFNNGFPPGTSVVSVGPQDTSGSATWTVDNSGNVTQFVRTAPNTYVQAMIIQIADPMVKIGSGSPHIVEILSILQVDDAFNLALKQINDNAGNNLADWSAGGLFLKGNPANHNKLNYQSDGSNTDWTMAANSHGTGTSSAGSANFNHNLKVAGANATPDVVLITPTGGQFSYAVTAKTSTQFTLSASAAQTFDFVAIKF